MKISIKTWWADLKQLLGFSSSPQDLKKQVDQCRLQTEEALEKKENFDDSTDQWDDF